MSHTFHIPVMGLAFSIDTPVKVARYGIDSVVSIVDDMLIERMRKFYSDKVGVNYVPIEAKERDSRAKRITAYLDLLKSIVVTQFNDLKRSSFMTGSEIVRYFELLPESSSLKKQYRIMQQSRNPKTKATLQRQLRENMTCGEIDVNIMAKVDKLNYTKKGKPLGDKFTDALAALRGFAQSQLNSALIISAGLNPRLYSALEAHSDFYPNAGKMPKKRIILKVSDFRSAFIQAKLLAKKGLWVSEFRIESGLNCGGHAFATEGYLLGPILEEFKAQREAMVHTLYEMYQNALVQKGISVGECPAQKLSVQGGIGTAEEHCFLMKYYKLDRTGWGSPFLLVPEATTVDAATLEALKCARADDFYISGSSPLGVPFNNFKGSTAETERLARIKRGRPGSPCKKKFLVSNSEFTQQPICTASREYQHLKIKQLEAKELSPEAFKAEYEGITEKACLCEGLAAAAYVKHDILENKESRAVAICPGPNVAYFSRSFRLDEMIKHIYGQVNLLEHVDRPHMFINELKLYISYLKKEINMQVGEVTERKLQYFQRFKAQIQKGILYYKQLIPNLLKSTDTYKPRMLNDLLNFELQLANIPIQSEQFFMDQV